MSRLTGYDTFWTFSCSPLQFMHDFRRYLPHPVFAAAPPGTAHHFWDYVIYLHCLFQHFRAAFAIFVISLDSENSIILSYTIRNIRFSASYARKLTSTRKKRTARTFPAVSICIFSSGRKKRCVSGCQPDGLLHADRARNPLARNIKSGSVVHRCP